MSQSAWDQGKLLEIFERINQKHFDGFLDAPALEFNSRLRTSAGRFVPGTRRALFSQQRPPLIEVAQYLVEEADSFALIEDTIAHEMIHYWLWVRYQPYGHTEAFYRKMKEMGVSRYNQVPRQKPHKYIYRCPSCLIEFKARRKLGPLACLHCCKTHNEGRFDPRFKIVLHVQVY